MKLLGHLSESDRQHLLEWCHQQHLGQVTRSRLAPKRLEKWYGLASNLGYLHTNQAKVYVATAFDTIPDYLKQMGNFLLPGWNSILLCGGITTISLHKDHPHFDNEAVMVNLGEATFQEVVKKQATSYDLKMGDVVRLAIQTPHQATQLSDVRYNITFRQIKPAFLGEVQDFLPTVQSSS